jgi:hypothetical protein
MISVIFFKLARKKNRSSKIKKQVQAKPKNMQKTFGTVDLKELLKNGSVKGG